MAKRVRKIVKQTKKMKKAKEIDKKINITYADILSFINALLGFSAIILLFRLGDFVLPSVLLILAVVVDFFDGKVARRFKQANKLGKNIDLLADTISFVVAPAVFMQQFLSGYAVFLPFLVIVGGIYRLARFSISDKDYFEGMPSAFNNLIIAALYLFGLFNGGMAIVLSIVLPILMVCKFKIKKFL